MRNDDSYAPIAPVGCRVKDERVDSQVNLIPSRLLRAMRAAGTSPRELGDAIGASASTIRRYIKAERSPSARHLIAMSLATGVPTDYLLGFDRSWWSPTVRDGSLSCAVPPNSIAIATGPDIRVQGV